MATTLNANNQASLAYNTTGYYALVGSATVETTEARKQCPVYSAGVFSKLKVKVGANTVDGTFTFVLRVGAASVNSTVAFSASSTGLQEDNSNTDTIISTNKLNYKASAAGATTGNIQADTTSITFAATTNTAQMLMCGNGPAFDDNLATTRYNPINGGGTTNELTESRTAYTFKNDGTIRNGSWYVRLNNRTVSTTYTTRIAGSNGNVTMTLAGSTTGLTVDNANTDTITSGQIVNWGGSTTAEAQAQIGNLLGCEFITTNDAWHSINGVNAAGGTSQNASTTNYHVPGASNTQVSTTESVVQTKMSFAINATNGQITIIANLGTTDGNETLYVNGAASALAVTITALTTGLFVNNSDTVLVGTGATISNGVTTGDTAATTKGTFGFKGILTTDPVVVNRCPLMLMGVG